MILCISLGLDLKAVGLKGFVLASFAYLNSFMFAFVFFFFSLELFTALVAHFLYGGSDSKLGSGISRIEAYIHGSCVLTTKHALALVFFTN